MRAVVICCWLLIGVLITPMGFSQTADGGSTSPTDLSGRPHEPDPELLDIANWLRDFLPPEGGAVPDPEVLGEEIRRRLRAIERDNGLVGGEGVVETNGPDQVELPHNGGLVTDNAVDQEGYRRWMISLSRLERARRNFDGEVELVDGELAFYPAPSSEYYNWMMATDTCQENPSFAACEPDARVPICLRLPEIAHCEEEYWEQGDLCDAFVPDVSISDRREALMSALRSTQEWREFLREVVTEARQIAFERNRELYRRIDELEIQLQQALDENDRQEDLLQNSVYLYIQHYGWPDGRNIQRNRERSATQISSLREQLTFLRRLKFLAIIAAAEGFGLMMDLDDAILATDEELEELRMEIDGLEDQMGAQGPCYLPPAGVNDISDLLHLTDR